MKMMLSRIKTVIQPLGYKKNQSRFYKYDSGFYKLIDFQKGAYGDYFFINVCVHPIGLPQLLSGKLVIPDKPLEYECILRHRMTEASPAVSPTGMHSDSATCNDDVITDRSISAIVAAAEDWMTTWGSFNKIVQSDEHELMSFITVVPLIKNKACAMLKCYCSIKLNNIDNARLYYSEYQSCTSGRYSFGIIDDYLSNLISSMNTNATGEFV